MIQMKPKSTQSFNSDRRSKSLAKFLRRNQTPAEERLWNIVRNRGVGGLKFRRQHPLANFIVDFYCHELKLVVELDGDIHDKTKVKIRDEAREYFLRGLGLTVLRFRNDEVFLYSDFVADKILSFRTNLQPPTNPHPSVNGHPLPKGEGS